MLLVDKDFSRCLGFALVDLGMMPARVGKTRKGLDF